MESILQSARDNLTGLLKAVDQHAGVSVYGTWNGFTASTAGRLALLRARRAHPHSNIGMRLPGEPHVDMGAPYDQSWLENLHEAAEAALSSDAATEVNAGNDLIQKFISSSDFSFKEHVDLSGFFPPDVREAIESYLGSYFQVDEIRTYRNFPVAEERERDPSPYNWHLDRFPPTQIKLFILLTDVTEKHGPTEYVKTSPSEFSNHETNIYRQTNVQPDNVTQITGERGTTYLFAPNRVVHRAGTPEDGIRDMIYARIFPSTEPLADKWMEKEPYTNDENHSNSPLKHLMAV